MNILTEPQHSTHPNDYYKFVVHVDGLDYLRSMASVSSGETDLAYSTNGFVTDVIIFHYLERQNALTPVHQYVWNLIKLSD